VHFLDLTLPTLEDNLALDEALLLEAEAGPSFELLRVWEWDDHAVVLGAGSRLSQEVFEAVCQADAVPISRRPSGGGTVLLGTGCLLYSLVLPYRYSPELEGVRRSHCYLLSRLREALGVFVAGIEVAGTSDLAVGGRKFSGNSQQRKRAHLLHHGSILYAFDITRISRYLPIPPRQPAYRSGRQHSDFLTNLPAPASALKQQIQSAWNANVPVQTWPNDAVKQLVRDKYGRQEWIRRL